MIRAMAMALGLGLIAMPALAQSAAPETDNGRYTIKQLGNDMLRLDTRTGQVSLCAKGSAGWTCRAVPDDRAAMEIEIGRLQTENEALRKQVAELSDPNTMKPPATPKSPLAQKREELNLPSDAELDRVMAFVEKLWKRLLDMVQSAPIEKKT